MKHLIIVLTLILSAAVARAEEANLLKNASLEGDSLPYEWDLSDAGEASHGEMAQDADAGQNGASCLRITHPPAGDHYTQLRQLVDVVPEAKYVIRARVKTENIQPKGQAPAALIGLYTTGGNTIAVERVNTQGEWIDVELEAKAPETGKAFFVIYFDAAEGSYWIENVSLERAQE